ncbi:MAG: hypothetical protein ACLTW9_14875 [Enterocloster sp.]
MYTASAVFRKQQPDWLRSSASVIYGNPGNIFLNHRTAGNVDYYLVANSSDERRNLVLVFQPCFYTGPFGY